MAQDLDIWKDARSLCRVVFAVTSKGLFCRDYRFKDQIRASSGSIMDNIAEGFERGGNKEFIQFLAIAEGPCGETRSQAYRAFDFKYIKQEDLREILDRTMSLSKRISGFISYLKKSTYKGSKYANPKP
ncbi:S23 ribosomal protein [delta proteobacterium NaphS2]|nr:S23 ribosomal protein [delta proteobacterium NaphS2]